MELRRWVLVIKGEGCICDLNKKRTDRCTLDTARCIPRVRLFIARAEEKKAKAQRQARKSRNQITR